MIYELDSKSPTPESNSPKPQNRVRYQNRLIIGLGHLGSPEERQLRPTVDLAGGRLDARMTKETLSCIDCDKA